MINLKPFPLSLSWTEKKLAFQRDFISQLDDMVTDFLDMPEYLSVDYCDYQFARHLLWHIEDEKKNFRLMFKRGADPLELSTFWIHLMPFITGQFPETILPFDQNLLQFSNKMYIIVHDLIMYHISDFNDLLEQIVELMRDIRRLDQKLNPVSAVAPLSEHG